jgi:hypothetical protein
MANLVGWLAGGQVGLGRVELLWQRIPARECWMSKHCISDSGRRKRSIISSRASIPIRHT